MARKTQDYVITRDGRDKGKTFVLNEMPAVKGDKWAKRLLMGMVRAGVDLPEDIYETGMAGVAAAGFKALLTIPWEIAEPLLDELMTCVTIKPDPRNPSVERGLIPDDIEEVVTHMTLQSGVFELHTGFSVAGMLSHLIQLIPAEITTSMSTLAKSSAQSSAPDSPPSTN